MAINMKTFEFDGEKYKKASKHQKEWGNNLIDELSLNGDEEILDLGCGDGGLTEQLAQSVPRGRVLGIDASAGMIAAAQNRLKSNLVFMQMEFRDDVIQSMIKKTLQPDAACFETFRRIHVKASKN